ncbi:hypothetical protein [Nisaea sp.]|uniref:hypothetical protein n=1 Tax=Nisaea sp. TaxID=2024842 RepID=UPI0032633C7D
MASKDTIPVSGDAEDLLEALRKRAFLSEEKAKLVLTNNAPAKWNTMIVAAGVKFFFRDGTNFTDGPRELQLPTGDRTVFSGNDPRGCVFQYVVATLVIVDDDIPEIITYRDGMAPGQCMQRATISLQLPTTISESSLASGRKSARLGLSSVD